MGGRLVVTGSMVNLDLPTDGYGRVVGNDFDVRLEFSSGMLSASLRAGNDHPYG